MSQIHGKQIKDNTVVKSFNGSTYSEQYLTTIDDTNIKLTIDTDSITHSISVGWTGSLPLERGGLNNTSFNNLEPLVVDLNRNAVISSGYKFNDNGDTQKDIWSANKIMDYYSQRKVIFTIGDGTNNIFNLNHELGTRFVIVQIFDLISGVQVEADIIRTDDNYVRVSFSNPPTLDEFSIVIS